MRFNQTRKFQELVHHFVAVGKEVRYLTTREQRTTNLVERYRKSAYVNDDELRQVIAKANQCLHEKMYIMD